MKRAVILSILFALVSRVGAEDPVEFADPNLKSAVEAALGVSDPTPTDMLWLEVLEAFDAGITDLTGLEYAWFLQELVLYTNQISDVSPLAGLTGLSYLYLNRNQISDLSPLAGLTNLARLYLDTNQIGRSSHSSLKQPASYCDGIQ